MKSNPEATDKMLILNSAHNIEQSSRPYFGDILIVLYVKKALGVRHSTI